MALPMLTYLQYLILVELGGQWLSGEQLRARLAARSMVTQGPAFYQLMARLEKGGRVASRLAEVTHPQGTHRERWYAVTPLGSDELRRNQKFYDSVR